MSTEDPQGSQAKTSSTSLTTALMEALGKEVEKVRVKVPPFWSEKPAVWFAQIEAQFELARITTDSTKYYTVVGNLETSVIAELEDIISNPPATNRYEKLKQELIKRLSASQEKKVRQLLVHEELGDRKPSAFMRHLQSLAGPGVPEDFLRTIWTSRLPTNLQAIVASQADTSLEAVAELADRVMEIAPVNPVAQVASASASSDVFEVMRREIAALTQKVSEMSSKVDGGNRRQGGYNGRRNRSNNRDRFRSRSRSRSRPFRMENDSPICWYHSKYRENAHHCNKPCNYTSQAENSKASR